MVCAKARSRNDFILLPPYSLHIACKTKRTWQTRLALHVLGDFRSAQQTQRRRSEFRERRSFWIADAPFSWLKPRLERVTRLFGARRQGTAWRWPQTGVIRYCELSRGTTSATPACRL